MEYSTVLSLVNIGLIVTYVLLGIALLGALGGGIISLILDIIAGGIKIAGGVVNFFMEIIKRSKGALIGVVGIMLVVGLAFVFSSGSDISEIVLDKTNTAQWWVRPVGTGLLTFYILLIGTVGLILTTEVLRPFKK